MFGRKKRKKVKIFETKPKGRFISFLSQFIGALVTIGAGILFFVEFLTNYSYGIWGLTDALPFFFLAGLGMGLYLNGRKTKKMLSRFRFYKKILEGRDYISLEELSDLTRRKVDFLREDLKKMLDRRLFLQGRFDEEEVYFFLTEEGCREYCESNETETPFKEEANREEKKSSILKRNKIHRVKKLWKNKVKEAGTDWKEKMQEAGEGLKSRWQEKEGKIGSDAIEGEEKNCQSGDFKTMAAEYLVFYEKIQKKIQSRSVQRIVTDFGVYTVRILAHDIEEESRARFFQYYLPLTEKLLLSYKEMEQEQMAEKASDMEDLLNTIRYSFEIFAEKLADGKGMDVETDILALNSMMNIE